MAGVAPGSLLDVETPVLAEYGKAVGEWQTRWSNDTELLASILEMLHTLVRVNLAAGGAKALPQPLEVPRPGREKNGVKALTPQQLAVMSGVKRR